MKMSRLAERRDLRTIVGLICSNLSSDCNRPIRLAMEVAQTQQAPTMGTQAAEIQRSADGQGQRKNRSSVHRKEEKSILNSQSPNNSATNPIANEYADCNRMIAHFDSLLRDSLYVAAFVVGMRFVEVAVLEVPKHKDYKEGSHRLERSANFGHALRVSRVLQELLKESSVQEVVTEAQHTRVRELVRLAQDKSFRTTAMDNDQDQGKTSETMLLDNRKLAPSSEKQTKIYVEAVSQDMTTKSSDEQDLGSSPNQDNGMAAPPQSNRTVSKTVIETAQTLLSLSRDLHDLGGFHSPLCLHDPVDLPDKHMAQVQDRKPVALSVPHVTDIPKESIDEAKHASIDRWVEATDNQKEVFKAQTTAREIEVGKQAALPSEIYWNYRFGTFNGGQGVDLGEPPSPDSVSALDMSSVLDHSARRLEPTNHTSSPEVGPPEVRGGQRLLKESEPRPLRTSEGSEGQGTPNAQEELHPAQDALPPLIPNADHDDRASSHEDCGSIQANVSEWENAVAMVGSVPREEAEQSLISRLASLRRRLAPSTPNTGYGNDEMIPPQVAGVGIDDLHDFMLRHCGQRRRGQEVKKMERMSKTKGRVLKGLKERQGNEVSNRKPFHFNDSDASDGDETSSESSSTDDFADCSSAGSCCGNEIRQETGSVLEKNQAYCIRSLIRILESGESACAGVEGRPVVPLLGQTGAGKSLLINMIDGQQFKRLFNRHRQRMSYFVDGQGPRDFAVQQDFKSEARHVRAYSRRDTYYIDTSGFGNKHCTYADLATSLSVRDLARRCSKMRIAVLVNVFAFHCDATNHVRDLLELVSMVVGRNFAEFKTMFTFIFTHCRDAFACKSYAQGPEDESDGATIESLRSQLLHLLAAVEKSKLDQDSRSLVDFMRSSLEKEDPFCVIFEPGLCNSSDICEQLEHSDSWLVNPGKKLHYALTPSSQAQLTETLNCCTQTANEKLDDRIFDDVLKETINDIVRLAAFVDDDCCRAAVKDTTERLKNTKKELGQTIRRVVSHEIVPSSRTILFDSSIVRQVKESIDGLKELSLLIDLCEKGNRPPGESDSSESESQLTQDATVNAWNCIHERLLGRAEWIKDEFARAKSYLALCESLVVGSSKPDFVAVCAVLQELRAWEEVFEVEVAPMVAAAEESAIKGLLEAPMALDSLESKDSVVERVYGCLRITAFFKEAGRSGLLDCLFGQTSIGKTKIARLECYAYDARHRTRAALTEFARHLTKVEREAFSAAPVDVAAVLIGGSTAREYGRVLRVADNVGAVVLAEGLSVADLGGGPSISRLTLLEATMVKFRQHLMVCDRLACRINDPDIPVCLQSCLCCLHGIASNLPRAFQEEGEFVQDLEERVKKFTKTLGIHFRGSTPSSLSGRYEGLN